MTAAEKVQELGLEERLPRTLIEHRATGRVHYKNCVHCSANASDVVCSVKCRCRRCRLVGHKLDESYEVSGAVPLLPSTRLTLGCAQLEDAAVDLDSTRVSEENGTRALCSFRCSNQNLAGVRPSSKPAIMRPSRSFFFFLSLITGIKYTGHACPSINAVDSLRI